MLSTNEAAKKLGLAASTLSRYIILGKIPAPKVVQAGLSTVHAWTEEEIEAVRKLLPKLKNGRKTRYKKKQAAKTRKAQPRAAVPHKTRKLKTK